MQHRLSVVMLSYNSAHYLPQTIPALIEVLGAGDNEIYIVDNGSTDGSIACIQGLAEQYPTLIKPIYNSQNLGTTVSRNQALARASGAYVLVLDSDIIAYSLNAIQKLCDTLNENPDIGLIIPKLVYPDGRFQISTDVFPSPLRKFKRFLGLKKQEIQARAPDQTIDVDYAISAFWLMPRRTLEAVGLLDEKIFYAPEDVDYCIRIWKAGLRITYVPQCTVTHDAQEIGRALLKVKRWPFIASHIKGLLYLFAKHRYVSRSMLMAKINNCN